MRKNSVHRDAETADYKRNRKSGSVRIVGIKARFVYLSVPRKEPQTGTFGRFFYGSKGEKIAIVGYNGAGKTTLTKLLMRLYDVTDGAIFYNGTDIRNYDISSFRAHIGSVFQDYKIFAATIGENVMGGTYTDAQKRR